MPFRRQIVKKMTLVSGSYFIHIYHPVLDLWGSYWLKITTTYCLQMKDWSLQENRLQNLQHFIQQSSIKSNQSMSIGMEIPLTWQPPIYTFGLFIFLNWGPAARVVPTTDGEHLSIRSCAVIGSPITPKANFNSLNQGSSRVVTCL